MVLYLVLGLGLGAVYAALALGLVMVHKVSGVVNVAQGAMASVGAYSYVALTERGLATLPAVVGGVAAATAVGTAAFLAVFRPLARRPVLTRVVAAVGLAAAVQGALTVGFGSANRAVAGVLPATPLHLGGVTVPGDRLALAATVVVLALGLGAAYRFSALGVASRALADDPRAVALAGWSPTAVAAGNWAAASAVTGFVGILAAPIAALNPLGYSLLVVPALAAAVVGGLAAFVPTVATAFALGVGQAALLRLDPGWSWLPGAGLRQGLPLLVVLVAVAARRRPLEGGGPLAEAGVGDVASPVVPGVGRIRAVPAAATGIAAGIAAGMALGVLGGDLRLGLLTSLVATAACLSVVIVTGYLGLVSVAQVALAGVAAFVLARVGSAQGLGFAAAAAAGVAAAVVVGVTVALPALRVGTTATFAVTLVAAVAIEELVFANPAVSGALGGRAVAGPRVGPWDLAVGAPGSGGFPRPAFGWLALVVVAALAAGVAELRNRPLGRRLLAVRSAPRAVASLGIGVTTTRLVGFAAGASVAGVAGVLGAALAQRASPADFGVFLGITVLALTVVGGVGRAWGAVVGGLLASAGLVVATLARVADVARWHLLASGLVVMVVAAALPEGVAGALARAWYRGRGSRPRPGGGG